MIGSRDAAFDHDQFLIQRSTSTSSIASEQSQHEIAWRIEPGANRRITMQEYEEYSSSCCKEPKKSLRIECQGPPGLLLTNVMSAVEKLRRTQSKDS
eukprot:751662-Hanusia_phi.AAC.1